MAAKKKAKSAKLNPADLGFDEGAWDNIDDKIKSWIVLNKELWNGLSKLQQKTLKASTDFTKNAKAASEASKETAKNTEDLSKSLKTSSGNMKKIAASRMALETMGAKILVYDQKSDALSKRRVKSITAIVDISKDYMANMDAIGTDEFRSLDFNKQIRDAIKAKLPIEEAYLRKLKAEHDVQKKLNSEINAQADLIKKPFGMIDDMVKRIPVVGDMLSAKLDLAGKGQDMADKFVEASVGGAGELESGPEKKAGGLDMRFKKNKEFVKSQGKSAGLMKKMGPASLAVGAAIAGWAVATFKFAADMGVAFSQISPAMLLFKEQTKAMLDEFGGIDDVSSGMLWTMKKASFLSGVQASDMAKMAMLQTSITTDTKAMALDKQAKFMKEIKNQGLSAAKIMGDLASHADMFAMYAKDGGKNMEEAAKQAASMGLSLDATSAVAEKLLDWESSIAAEMEASMILGRSINLDKARSLAYSGDLANMMIEVKNQAGGEAEFAKMSVVQRQSLGEAIGLQGAQLAEFMKTEKEVTDASNAALYKKMIGFGIISTIVLALVGAIVGAIPGLNKVAWQGMKKGAGKGAKIGAGIGLAGAAGTFAAGRASGGPVKAGSPYVVGERGSELFVPMSAGSIIPHAAGGAGPAIDNSDITSRMDKQFEQNERLFRKLGRDVDGAFAQR
jgi:hypothetical protein